MIKLKIVSINNQPIHKYLDIEKDDLAFKINQNIFNFSGVNNRTVEFNIPTTPNNDDIFRLPYDIARGDISVLNNGKIEAILTVNSIVINGFVKLTECSDLNYKIAFYYNNTFLDDIYKNLSNYLDLNDGLIWDSNTTIYNGGGNLPLPVNFGLYKYKTEAGEADIPTYINYLPSVSMKYLIDSACSELGYSYTFDIADPAILADRTNKFNRMLIKLKSAKWNNRIKGWVEKLSDNNNYTNPYILGQEMNGIFNNINYNFQFIIGGNWTSVAVASLISIRECSLDFFSLPLPPAGYDAIAIRYQSGQVRVLDLVNTVQIPVNTIFTFIAYNTLTNIYTNLDNYTDLQGIFAFDCILTNTDLNYGDYYSLQANLPECSLFSLLQLVATVLRLGISGDAFNKTFTFTPYEQYDKIIDLTKILARKEIVVKYGGAFIEAYEFDSSNFVLSEMKLYSYPSDSYKKMVFSEERKYRDTYNVLISDITPSGQNSYTFANSQKDVITYFANGGEFLDRIFFATLPTYPYYFDGNVYCIYIYISNDDFLKLNTGDIYFLFGKHFRMISATYDNNIAMLEVLKMN